MSRPNDEVVYVRVERCPRYRPEDRQVDETALLFKLDLTDRQKVEVIANAAGQVARRMYRVETRPGEGGR